MCIIWNLIVNRGWEIKSRRSILFCFFVIICRFIQKNCIINNVHSSVVSSERIKHQTIRPHKIHCQCALRVHLNQVISLLFSMWKMILVLIMDTKWSWRNGRVPLQNVAFIASVNAFLVSHLAFSWCSLKQCIIWIRSHYYQHSICVNIYMLNVMNCVGD